MSPRYFLNCVRLISSATLFSPPLVAFIHRCFDSISYVQVITGNSCRHVRFSLAPEHVVDFRPPFDRCLTSSLISYIVNTTCASGLIHYCTILCSTPHYCTALYRSWRKYVEAPEPVELAPGPLCFHRKADRTQYPSMRKLLHVPGPDNHCFASVKNAAENKPSASAKSKNKCSLYNRNLPVLTFAKLLLSCIAWASPWAPPLMPTNCHNNFFEWSDLQKLGTRKQIDILCISDFFLTLCAYTKYS